MELPTSKIATLAETVVTEVIPSLTWVPSNFATSLQEFIKETELPAVALLSEEPGAPCTRYPSAYGTTTDAPTPVLIHSTVAVTKCKGKILKKRHQPAVSKQSSGGLGSLIPNRIREQARSGIKKGTPGDTRDVPWVDYRLSSTGRAIAIPECFDGGFFELLSEDGKPVRALDSVRELAVKEPKVVVVLDAANDKSVAAFVAKSPGDASTQESDSVPLSMYDRLQKAYKKAVKLKAVGGSVLLPRDSDRDGALYKCLQNKSHNLKNVRARPLQVGEVLAPAGELKLRPAERSQMFAGMGNVLSNEPKSMPILRCVDESGQSVYLRIEDHKQSSKNATPSFRFGIVHMTDFEPTRSIRDGGLSRHHDIDAVYSIRSLIATKRLPVTVRLISHKILDDPSKHNTTGKSKNVLSLRDSKTSDAEQSEMLLRLTDVNTETVVIVLKMLPDVQQISSIPLNSTVHQVYRTETGDFANILSARNNVYDKIYDYCDNFRQTYIGNRLSDDSESGESSNFTHYAEVVNELADVCSVLLPEHLSHIAEINSSTWSKSPVDNISSTKKPPLAAGLSTCRSSDATVYSALHARYSSHDNVRMASIDDSTPRSPASPTTQTSESYDSSRPHSDKSKDSGVAHCCTSRGEHRPGGGSPGCSSTHSCSKSPERTEQEIDAIYDYIRGTGPLPTSCKKMHHRESTIRCSERRNDNCRDFDDIIPRREQHRYNRGRRTRPQSAYVDRSGAIYSQELRQSDYKRNADHRDQMKQSESFKNDARRFKVNRRDELSNTISDTAPAYPWAKLKVTGSHSKIDNVSLSRESDQLRRDVHDRQHTSKHPGRHASAAEIRQLKYGSRDRLSNERMPHHRSPVRKMQDSFSSRFEKFTPPQVNKQYRRDPDRRRSAIADLYHQNSDNGPRNRSTASLNRTDSQSSNHLTTPQLPSASYSPKFQKHKMGTNRRPRPASMHYNPVPPVLGSLGSLGSLEGHSAPTSPNLRTGCARVIRSNSKPLGYNPRRSVIYEDESAEESDALYTPIGSTSTRNICETSANVATVTPPTPFKPVSNNTSSDTSRDEPLKPSTTAGSDQIGKQAMEMRARSYNDNQRVSKDGSFGELRDIIDRSIGPNRNNDFGSRVTAGSYTNNLNDGFYSEPFSVHANVQRVPVPRINLRNLTSDSDNPASDFSNIGYARHPNDWAQEVARRNSQKGDRPTKYETNKIYVSSNRDVSKSTDHLINRNHTSQINTSHSNGTIFDRGLNGSMGAVINVGNNSSSINKIHFPNKIVDNRRQSYAEKINRYNVNNSNSFNDHPTSRQEKNTISVNTAHGMSNVPNKHLSQTVMKNPQNTAGSHGNLNRIPWSNFTQINNNANVTLYREFNDQDFNSKPEHKPMPTTPGTAGNQPLAGTRYFTSNDLVARPPLSAAQLPNPANETNSSARYAAARISHTPPATVHSNRRPDTQSDGPFGSSAKIFRHHGDNMLMRGSGPIYPSGSSRDIRPPSARVVIGASQWLAARATDNEDLSPARARYSRVKQPVRQHPMANGNIPRTGDTRASAASQNTAKVHHTVTTNVNDDMTEIRGDRMWKNNRPVSMVLPMPRKYFGSATAVVGTGHDVNSTNATKMATLTEGDIN